MTWEVTRRPRGVPDRGSSARRRRRHSSGTAPARTRSTAARTATRTAASTSTGFRRSTSATGRRSCRVQLQREPQFVGTGLSFAGNRSCSATTVSSCSLSARHASTAACAAESVVMHVTRCADRLAANLPLVGRTAATARRVDDQRHLAVLHLVEQVRPALRDLRHVRRPGCRVRAGTAPCRAWRSA